LAAQLAREWALRRVTFKPFPVCAFNQTPVTAALALRLELGRAAVSAVRVRMNPYEIGYAGMDAVGPFHSVSGTLMSIPFCIATTLLYGSPTMKRMTSYDDPKVAALISGISLIGDPGVATLSAIIEADTADGRTLVQHAHMSARDFAYDRPGVVALARRIGAEENVPAAAFERLEAFVERWPAVGITEVLAAFAMVEEDALAA
jgi:2-methylcitrate dehydratase PrpD